MSYVHDVHFRFTARMSRAFRDTGQQKAGIFFFEIVEGGQYSDCNYYLNRSSYLDPGIMHQDCTSGKRICCGASGSISGNMGGWYSF